MAFSEMYCTVSTLFCLGLIVLVCYLTVLGVGCRCVHLYYLCVHLKNLGAN